MRIKNLTQNELETYLKWAVDSMVISQPDICGFTPMTGQTEWNLGHHLAFELKKFFPEYDCDLDATKNFRQPDLPTEHKRPDIIFHKRGTYVHDDLVVELKFNGTPAEIQEDRDKIHTYYFPPYELNYKFGAIINLFSVSEKEPYVEVIPNPNYRVPQ